MPTHPDRLGILDRTGFEDAGETFEKDLSHVFCPLLFGRLKSYTVLTTYRNSKILL
jgi:hypothetical protein